MQCRKTTFPDTAEPGRSWQLDSGGPGNDKPPRTPRQTGRGRSGCLMSVDIYCHWVGFCILQGTAAFPIGQLQFNGQQRHNEARLVDKWMQQKWQPNLFSPWELGLCNLMWRQRSLCLPYRRKSRGNQSHEANVILQQPLQGHSYVRFNIINTNRLKSYGFI